MKSIILSLLLIYIFTETQADSDGAVAFGDDFVAYTSFAKTGLGQDLNIVVLDTDGSLQNVATVNLPLSWSLISTKDNSIYVKTHKKIYEYAFYKPSTIKLIKTIEDNTTTEHLKPSNRKRNKHGDWVTENGNCENKKINDIQIYLCIAYVEYSTKFKFGALIFHDKLLISRFVEETISSLQITSHYETIH